MIPGVLSNASAEWYIRQIRVTSEDQTPMGQLLGVLGAAAVAGVLPWEKDSPHFLDSLNFHNTNDLGKLLFETKSFICFYQ